MIQQFKNDAKIPQIGTATRKIYDILDDYYPETLDAKRILELSRGYDSRTLVSVLGRLVSLNLITKVAPGHYRAKGKR